MMNMIIIMMNKIIMMIKIVIIKMNMITMMIMLWNSKWSQ